MMMSDEDDQDKDLDPAAVDALADEVGADEDEEEDNELGGFDAFGKEEEE